MRSWNETAAEELLHGSAGAKKELDNWEDMLSSDNDDEEGRPSDAASKTLSKEMKEKLLLQEQELQANYEDACDLLGMSNASIKVAAKTGVAVPKQPVAIRAGSGGGQQYSLDLAKPRTLADLTEFRKKIMEKLTSAALVGNPNYQDFMKLLVHAMLEELSLEELKKMVSHTQTLYNKKSSSSSSTAVAAASKGSTKKPALRFGGSLKTGFDHGLKELDDYDEDYY